MIGSKQLFLLEDPKILDATAVKMVKPLAQQQARLTKHIHLGLNPAATAPTPDEEDDKMAKSPLEGMLRKISKGTTRNTSHTGHLGNRVDDLQELINLKEAYKYKLRSDCDGLLLNPMKFKTLTTLGD